MSKKIALSLALLFASAVPLYAQDASTQTDFAQQEIDQRNKALLAAFQAGLQNFAAACQKGSREEVKAALEALIALEPCAAVHETSAGAVQLYRSLFGNQQERLVAAIEGVREFAQEYAGKGSQKLGSKFYFGVLSGDAFGVMLDRELRCSSLEKAGMLAITATRQEFLELMQEMQMQKVKAHHFCIQGMQEGTSSIHEQFLKKFTTFYVKSVVEDSEQERFDAWMEQKTFVHQNYNLFIRMTLIKDCNDLNY